VAPGGDRGVVHGRVVQVDPVKPTLKATGYERLKLNCDDLLSSFAFKFDLRRYSTVVESLPLNAYVAGDYTPPLLSST
jgi:hypothetical protein